MLGMLYVLYTGITHESLVLMDKLARCMQIYKDIRRGGGRGGGR
jgi:hypothetical protein